MGRLEEGAQNRHESQKVDSVIASCAASKPHTVIWYLVLALRPCAFDCKKQLGPWNYHIMTDEISAAGFSDARSDRDISKDAARPDATEVYAYRQELEGRGGGDALFV
jgi:hypothetical protein